MNFSAFKSFVIKFSLSFASRIMYFSSFYLNKGVKRLDNLSYFKVLEVPSVEINSIDLNMAVYAYFRKPGPYKN